MKGRQSKEFKRILADRDARKKLFEVVSNGEEGGSVTVKTGKAEGGEVTYSIKTGNTGDLKQAKSSGSSGSRAGGGRRTE